jgi:hypothetical protein
MLSSISWIEIIIGLHCPAELPDAGIAARSLVSTPWISDIEGSPRRALINSPLIPLPPSIQLNPRQLSSWHPFASSLSEHLFSSNYSTNVVRHERPARWR